MSNNLFSKGRLEETREIRTKKPYTGLSKGAIVKADTPHHGQFLAGVEKGIFFKKHFAKELQTYVLCDKLLGRKCPECAKPSNSDKNKNPEPNKNMPQEALGLPLYMFDFIGQKMTDREGKVLEYDLSPECAFEIKISGDTEGNEDKIILYDSEGALTNDVWEFSTLAKSKGEIKWLQLKPPAPLDMIGLRNFKKMFGDKGTVPVEIQEKWDNYTIQEAQGLILSALVLVTDEQWKIIEESGIVRPKVIERGTPVDTTKDDDNDGKVEEPQAEVSFNRKR